MITRDDFQAVLESLAFTADLSGVWVKTFAEGAFTLSVDFTNERLQYPDALIVRGDQTLNFSMPENFVVFECVHRLFEKGYKPEHIELEHPVKVGHGASGGRLDIWIKDNDGHSLLIIECKTAGKEFENAWRDTLEDGGQLFSYVNALDSKTPFVALYASDWNGEIVVPGYNLVSLQDNDEFLKTLPKDAPSFKKAATVKERFRAWRETYQQDFTTRGLFESDIAAYTTGKNKYSIQDLKVVDGSAIQGKYHEFATILRQHNVASHENAFDKLINLFLAKIVDEIENPEELKFYWKGAAYDDAFSLVDRLQYLYKRGMEGFLNETITYVENKNIEDAFRLFKKDATKQTILGYFRELKFFTNNDFAFIDVHNEKLFHQNAAVLLKIVRMLQDIRLQTQKPNQFLGDLFEGFLDKGVKQSEGQFFTPTPIVRFLISSLPLETLIAGSPKPPLVIDYACGAGHFLNEYCNQILPFVRKKNAVYAQQIDGIEVKPIWIEHLKPYYEAVTGIEKEYRLSKVSKVSASMYGQADIHIVYADALAAHPDVRDGTYSILVANPPYSVKGFLETLSEADRARYELFDPAGDMARNNSIECLFVERAKQLLAPGGVAAIILPSSILSNTGVYTRMREILLKYFDIVAIAEFGSGTFGKTGTNTATLFLRRKATKPDIAEHYANRVEAWFEGDFTKDEEFDDSHLLAAYCNKIAIPLDIYKTLLVGTPSDTLLATEIFKEYRKTFDTSADVKSIHKKRITARYTEADRVTELKRAWFTFLREKESDKLYYYMLAANNPQPVVLVKSPADNKAMKAFLGYEWSSRKGDEGIKYLGAISISAAEEDTLSHNEGISHIATPLFNPAYLPDPKKLNSIIRAAFERGVSDIPESLSSFVSCAKLTDMLDFSRVSFDKAFKNTLETKAEIISKWPLVKLGDIAKYSTDTISAATLTPNTYVGVDNLLQSLGGKTDSDFVPTSGKITRYTPGDILLSNIRPYLKKMWFADSMGGASNDVLVLRVADTAFDRRFVYYILAQDAFFDYVMGAVKGVKMPRGDKAHILDFPIPQVPLDIQRQIVSECECVDAECEAAHRTIKENNDKIARILNISSDTQKISLTQIGKFVNERIDAAKLTVQNYVGVDNLLPDTQGKRDSDFVPASGTSTKYRSKDILLSNIRPYLKKIWFADCEGGSSNDVLIVRVSEDVALPEFVYQLLRQDAFFDYEMQSIKGMKMPRGDKKHIMAYPIPVPSLAEQTRIIAEVEKYESEITAARAILANAHVRKSTVLTKLL